MSDPTNEKPTDGESDVQASNDGTAGVGEDPRGESSFNTEHTESTDHEHAEHHEHTEHEDHAEKGGGGR
jgi:hypothetical protein